MQQRTVADENKVEHQMLLDRSEALRKRFEAIGRSKYTDQIQAIQVDLAPGNAEEERKAWKLRKINKVLNPLLEKWMTKLKI